MTEKKYRVTRHCCTSGNCIRCIGMSPVGTPVRIIHTWGLPRAKAAQVAANWARFDARIEEEK